LRHNCLQSRNISMQITDNNQTMAIQLN